MKNRIKLLIILALAAPCSAQVGQVRDLYQSILNGKLPSDEELFLKVNENTVGALSGPEALAVLPFARQCLQSSRPEVRQDGLVLFMAVGMRPDSAKLLDSYIDDLGALLSGPEGAISLRHGALYILGSTKPHLVPKAADYLNKHLEDNRNSNEEALTIAASLLDASPSDPATVHKVLGVAVSRADTGLTTGIIRTLGLRKTRNAEALNFLSANLSHADSHVRESAVDAVSRLDRDLHFQFANQLARIASDPRESEHVRSLAVASLKRQQ